LAAQPTPIGNWEFCSWGGIRGNGPTIFKSFQFPMTPHVENRKPRGEKPLRTIELWLSSPLAPVELLVNRPRALWLEPALPWAIGLRCRRREIRGRKRAMLLCHDVMMQSSGQSTGEWENMRRVGPQFQPGSKGRDAPVLEPHGARTFACPGVEAHQVHLSQRWGGHLRVRCWITRGDWGGGAKCAEHRDGKTICWAPP
jgi:hypothetical protein